MHKLLQVLLVTGYSDVLVLRVLTGAGVIGILALWLVVKIPGSNKAKWEIVAMLGIVLFLTVLITPRIVSVGRSIDFVPRDPPPDGLRTFGLLHATYTVFDGIQLILGIVVTWWLVKTKD